MLKTYTYANLAIEDIEKLVLRNSDPNLSIQSTVNEIIEEVRQQGDSALVQYAAKFDQVQLEKLYLDKDEIEELAMTISREQQRALEIAFQYT
jgi:histidinol dehydrogenase